MFMYTRHRKNISYMKRKEKYNMLEFVKVNFWVWKGRGRGVNVSSMLAFMIKLIYLQFFNENVSDRLIVYVISLTLS